MSFAWLADPQDMKLFNLAHVDQIEVKEGGAIKLIYTEGSISINTPKLIDSPAQVLAAIQQMGLRAGLT